MKIDRDPQALFAARAEWMANEGTPGGVPPFASVLAEVRRREHPEAEVRPLKRRRSAFVVAFAAAAAACVALAVGTPRTRMAPNDPSTEVVAETRESFMCFDDPASLAVETAAYVTDRAVARAEDRFAACLVATPGLTGLAGRHDGLDCATTNSFNDVTCGAPRPLDDEIFASKIRGDEL